MLLEEHIASRKDWARYVDLITEVHRSTVAQADEFLADVRARIERALERQR